MPAKKETEVDLLTMIETRGDRRRKKLAVATSHLNNKNDDELFSTPLNNKEQDVVVKNNKNRAENSIEFKDICIKDEDVIDVNRSYSLRSLEKLFEDVRNIKNREITFS